jgi:hypothetical protein
MTIASYSDLKSAWRNWAKRSDTTAVPDARVIEFIALGEDRIRQEIRCRQMEATADLTVNAQRVSLPTGYVGMRRLYLSTDPIRNLEFLSPDQFWTQWTASQTNTPRTYTIEGDEIVFGPSPDTTYTGKALIYKLTALSDSNTTTPLLLASPGIYLNAALVASVPYTANQARLPEWEAGYQVAKSVLEKSSRRDRHGGGGLRMRSDSGNP